MNKALVGFTGFVGSNLVSQADFEGLYNSKNISASFGTKSGLLVYSGVRAEKFLANKEPERDAAIIQEAIENIKRIKPGVLVLISTIDVYKIAKNVDEDSVVDTHNLSPYGLNRYLLEKWVEEHIPNHLIIRLPGLYGKNLRKNFIYDMIHLIPPMLSESKFTEICRKHSAISGFYAKQDNGFYKCRELTEKEKKDLRMYFENIGFNALNFTDSRSTFQFYNVGHLWKHIQLALSAKIKKLNIATEPISSGALFKYIRGADFTNEGVVEPVAYDLRTKHAEVFGGANGYIFHKTAILDDIKRFVEGFSL